MADEQELAQGAGTEELNLETEQVVEEQQEKTNEPGPYDALARDLGWVPPEEYSGPGEPKTAEQFIRDGRDIQRETSREIKALRQTVETIGKTSATIVEQEVNRRVADLTAQHNQAVEEGDSKRAFEIARDIDKALATKAPVSTAPPAEAQLFADRNKSWFQKDALATATAVEVCNRLATQGYDTNTQLNAAEQEVRRLYPHLFPAQNNGKPQAGVERPSGRGPQSQGNKPKGFADMPVEAQKIANDMVSRGVIPDKDSYAKNYWLNAERMA